MEARFLKWVEKQRLPLKMESARWGDHHRADGQISTLELWETEVRRMLETHIRDRSETTLQQLAVYGFNID